MYMFDLETLGVESTSVVLSAAIIAFDLAETEYEVDVNEEYQHLLEKARFVKFDVKEQMKHYNRGSDKGTMQWWADQPELSRLKSFKPYADDLAAAVGIEEIYKYCSFLHGDSEKTIEQKRTVLDKSTIFWQRGSLDQLVFDSLCRVVFPDRPPIVQWNNWMDVRTAIALSKNSAKNGYCRIKDFDFSKVVKHDPVHDCAYDIMQLKHGY